MQNRKTETGQDRQTVNQLHCKQKIKIKRYQDYEKNEIAKLCIPHIYHSPRSTHPVNHFRPTTNTNNK
jgi:hypothetical protein